MSVLKLEGISKHFGAIHALDDVSLTLDAGEVLGLDGRQRRRKIDAGQDHRRQLPAVRRQHFHRGPAQVHFSEPIEARQSGIEIVYQDLALCDNLTAATNVFLGRELTRSLGPFKIIDYRRMNSDRRRAVRAN